VVTIEAELVDGEERDQDAAGQADRKAENSDER
jgi:hypothetical protein